MLRRGNAVQPFVGREAERARLRGALEQATRGRAAAALVVGEPGIGKTRLVEEVLREAAAAGALTALARPWDGGGAPPYAPIAQLLRDALEAAGPAAFTDGAEAEELAVLAAIAPAVARALRIAASGGVEPFAVADAVARRLAAIARDRPTAIAVDDLHTADPSTIAVLRHVARAARDARLLLLGTLRSVEEAAPAARPALEALLGEAAVLPLAGLDAAELEGWVGAAEAARVHRETAGNPLFVDGLLRAPAGAVVASDVRDAIGRRLAGLGPTTRALVEAAAVVGRPASLALLARALERPFAELLDPAGDAVRAGILAEASAGEHRFFHPLVREVTYASLAPSARAALHARAADALRAIHGASAHPPELARHLLAAAPLDRAEAAVVACREAGRAAMSVAAFPEAAGHLDDAQRAAAYLPPGAPWPVAREALALEHAEALLLAGDRDAACERFEAAAELGRAAGDGAILGRAALGLARALEFGAHEPRRLLLLGEAAAALGDAPTPLTARVLARLAQEQWMIAGEEASRGALAERAIAMAEATGDDDATAYAINAWLLCVWGPEHRAAREARAEALARLAARSDDLERRIEAHRWRINLAIEAGEIPRAAAAIRDYAEVAARLRRPDYLANARMREALLPQLRGETDAALALGAETRELAGLAGDPQADVVHDAFRVMLLADAGRTEALREALDPLRAHLVEVPRHVIYRAVLLYGLCAAGARAEAEVEWERLWRADLADVSRDMFWPAVLAALSAGALALDDHGRADRLIVEMTPLASLHAAIGASCSLGSVAGWLGRLHRARGRDAEAARYLREGMALEERMGAVGRAQALRDLLGAAPVPAVETPGEIASLAREGDLWRVEHRGRVAHVKDALGLGYLRTLLDRAGHDVPAADLAGVEGVASSALPALDETARRAYRARVQALRAELDEAESFADLGRAERARAELTAITRELARAYGLGGRARATGGSTERARTRVTKALRRAIAVIGEVLPELGQHLERSVQTGAFCRYEPDRRAPVLWR